MCFKKQTISTDLQKEAKKQLISCAKDFINKFPILAETATDLSTAHYILLGEIYEKIKAAASKSGIEIEFIFQYKTNETAILDIVKILREQHYTVTMKLSEDSERIVGLIINWEPCDFICNGFPTNDPIRVVKKYLDSDSDEDFDF